MGEIITENIVSKIQLADCFDLDKLCSVFPEGKYTPDELPAFILPYNELKAISIILPDGTVYVSGVKKESIATDIIDMILSRLILEGVKVYRNRCPTITNIVASYHCEKPVDLAEVVQKLDGAEYNPKSFPGIIYKTTDPNTVILLFDSGKIICDGSSYDDVSTALETILEKLTSIGAI